MNQYQQFIKDTLNWARANDVVKTQYEFAAAVGLDTCTVSAVLNEKYSGKVAARKVEKWRETVDKDFEPVFEPYTSPRRRPNPDWETFRRETAQRMLPVVFYWTRSRGIIDSEERSAKIAIEFADELIKRLKDGTE